MLPSLLPSPIFVPPASINPPAPSVSNHPPPPRFFAPQPPHLSTGTLDASTLNLKMASLEAMMLLYHETMLQQAQHLSASAPAPTAAAHAPLPTPLQQPRLVGDSGTTGNGTPLLNASMLVQLQQLMMAATSLPRRPPGFVETNPLADLYHAPPPSDTFLRWRATWSRGPDADRRQAVATATAAAAATTTTSVVGHDSGGANPEDTMTKTPAKNPTVPSNEVAIQTKSKTDDNKRKREREDDTHPSSGRHHSNGRARSATGDYDKDEHLPRPLPGTSPEALRKWNEADSKTRQEKCGAVPIDVHGRECNVCHRWNAHGVHAEYVWRHPTDFNDPELHFCVKCAKRYYSKKYRETQQAWKRRT
ncbi:hypothetical protein V8E36_005216 [Tilletia maclaganii]